MFFSNTSPKDEKNLCNNFQKVNKFCKKTGSIREKQADIELAKSLKNVSIFRDM